MCILVHVFFFLNFFHNFFYKLAFRFFLIRPFVFIPCHVFQNGY